MAEEEKEPGDDWDRSGGMEQRLSITDDWVVELLRRRRISDRLPDLCRLARHYTSLLSAD